MKRIVAAGASDIGQVRKGNEDSFFVADSVFAVADGMGGHLAGEVASAAALEPVSALDGRVFASADGAVEALREAVVSANQTVSKMAEDEPTYRGMGTTLTAAMLEGRRLHIAHVGDSRAYLLRDGRFRQLTDDHTLVQHLVDEGQISREQAANHPQRSVITRAIGVSPDIEVDTLSLDLSPGDLLVLCSDGLTGVVSDPDIADELLADDDLEVVVQRLIARANEAGGPDNITVVALRYEADGADAALGAVNGDDAGPRTVTISSRVDRDEPDWAGRIGSIGTLGHEAAEKDEPWSSRLARAARRLSAVVIGLLALGGMVGGISWYLLAQQYFVGLDDDRVVIYRGINTTVGPIELSWVVERSPLHVDEVQQLYQDRLATGVPARDLADARRYIAVTLPLREQDEAPDDADEPPDGDVEVDDGVPEFEPPDDGVGQFPAPQEPLERRAPDERDGLDAPDGVDSDATGSDATGSDGDAEAASESRP